MACQLVSYVACNQYLRQPGEPTDDPDFCTYEEQISGQCACRASPAGQCESDPEDEPVCKEPECREPAPNEPICE
jgi:hypothetical protein